MRNKLINISLIILLLSCSIATVYFRFKFVNINSQFDELSSRNKYLSYLLRTNWEFGSFDIYSPISGIDEDQNTEWTSLNSLKPILIYRQPVIGCTSCLEDRFNYFKYYSDSLNLQYIFVTKKTEKRNIINFRRLSQYQGKVYFNQYVIPELDNKGDPYILLLYMNQVISIHIPSLTHLEVTQSYLESIKKRLNVYDMRTYLEN